MTFIDFFSGIGGFRSGFEKAGMKCVGWCEFDKFAQKSYRAMYDTERLWFSDDVRKARGWELPKADIWTFGFPCQDISVAGRQKGIKRGTRSGLFFEIMRLLDGCENSKPEWLVCENVKNLLSIDRGRGMLTVLSEMDKRGYDAEWKVYNSKNYGVPQNRERVYIAGRIRGGSAGELLPIPRENGATLSQIIGGSQGERVYDSNAISCTLSANGGGQGAKTGLYSFIDFSNSKVKITDNARHLISRYTSGITKHAAVNSGVSLKNGTKKGYIVAHHGDGVDLSYPKSETRKARVQSKRSNTITTQSNLGVNYSIRKLTPRECWRLQGFTDEQFDKAQAVSSNSQLYKQAGNAVTVNVVYEIGKHIMGILGVEGENA